MKTVFLVKDLLLPSETRQASITQSQKESWLRSMEHERLSQFSSVAARDRAAGKVADSASSFGAGVKQVNAGGAETGAFRTGLSEGGLPTASLFQRGPLPISQEGYSRHLERGNSAFLPSGMYATPDGVEGSAPHDIAASAGLTFLERQLRQRWPRANVLVAKDGDGVRIWLRDPDLLKERSILGELVVRIKNGLASKGVFLNALTVNGETIFCNQGG